MNRAFISLYLIIVLSIVLLGLALNKIWDVVDPATNVDSAIEDIFHFAEVALESSTLDDKQKILEKFSQDSHYKFRVLHTSDFANSRLAEKIKAGQIVSAGSDNVDAFYKGIINSDNVFELTKTKPNANRSSAYIIFIIVFYVAVAAAIFLWVWPLSRDLARLARHTKQVGKDGVPQSIRISSRSVLYRFAKAFNKMGERINELISSQKEMTYAVSHELRTPLARMKFALAMAEDGTAKNWPTQLAGIRQDVYEMESLINALLAYAGFEQQSQQLSQRPGHIQDLVNSVVSRLSISSDRPVNISVVDQSNGEVFVCEWSLMQTAIQNVLDNAQGFARKLVKITLATTDSEFILIIDDDGRGIPADQRERIFESFVRLYGENSQRSGFGLGLAIVMRIMKWHNGNVTCSHAASGGASFILRWPKPLLINKQ